MCNPTHTHTYRTSYMHIAEIRTLLNEDKRKPKQTKKNLAKRKEEREKKERKRKKNPFLMISPTLPAI